ncbi:hypothetical protein KX928_23175 [Roseobacter sp. YSTF-M11]|uniref:Core-binding (CB) domain-containing protein n=1 Tax=Roseobacter insulae TaxID=2859783 RepID=A0A9X1G091_9RHOB|nr:hypothetical protein [Roseobacter insulae]MBW4710702.1 hypothetical protein [Roseobacter insulae]
MSSWKPITEKVTNLRQRRRADGSVRVWWEATADAQRLGFETVDLDANRPTWSKREAERLNLQLQRALNGTGAARGAGQRTISALIHIYRGSRHFKDRKPATRKSYNTNLNVIEAKWADALVIEFTKPVMDAWYDTLRGKHGDSYSKSIMLMMSRLMSFAETKGWRPEQSNPCARLGLKSAAPGTRFATWPEYDQLLKSADKLGMPAMACAIALSALNGARQTDIREARLDAFKWVQVPGTNGRLIWEFVRSKRGNHGIAAVHQLAAGRVQQLLDAATSGQVTLLVDHISKRPYNVRLFNARWREIRAHAAKAVPTVATLQFRDLRRTFGVWARAGGAMREDIGDVLGNSAAVDPILGETYMPPQFDSALRAIDAIKRPVDD